MTKKKEAGTTPRQYDAAFQAEAARAKISNQRLPLYGAPPTVRELLAAPATRVS